GWHQGWIRRRGVTGSGAELTGCGRQLVRRHARRLPPIIEVREYRERRAAPGAAGGARTSWRGFLYVGGVVLVWMGLSVGSVGGGGVVGVVAGAAAGVEAVFEVGHDPGAGAGAVAPDFDVAEVDGFHGAVAVVSAVAFGVAVVEAAAAVVVGAVEDGVHAFGLVAGGYAVGVVVAVAGAGGDVDAVGFVAVVGGGCG